MQKKNNYKWNLDVNPSDLIHYGVVGMKWGVRRYQNADGSYNSAGKARYGVGDGKSYQKLDKHTLRKYDKSLQKFYRNKSATDSSRKNTMEVSKKVAKELESTDEAKALHKMQDYATQQARAHGAKQVIFDRESASIYNEVARRYQEQAKKAVAAHQDEYAGAALRDMGMKDTELGREYIKNTKTFKQLLVS